MRFVDLVLLVDQPTYANPLQRKGWSTGSSDPWDQASPCAGPSGVRGGGGQVLGWPRSNTYCVSSVVVIIMKVQYHVLNDCHAAGPYQELEGTVGEMCL